MLVCYKVSYRDANETHVPLLVSRSVRLNSPGIGRDASSSSVEDTVSPLVRELRVWSSPTGDSDDRFSNGDVDSTPGVTGGVGSGVPPA